MKRINTTSRSSASLAFLGGFDHNRIAYVTSSPTLECPLCDTPTYLPCLLRDGRNRRAGRGHAGAHHEFSDRLALGTDAGRRHRAPNLSACRIRRPAPPRSIISLAIKLALDIVRKAGDGRAHVCHADLRPAKSRRSRRITSSPPYPHAGLNVRQSRQPERLVLFRFLHRHAARCRRAHVARLQSAQRHVHGLGRVPPARSTSSPYSGWDNRSGPTAMCPRKWSAASPTHRTAAGLPSSAA